MTARRPPTPGKLRAPRLGRVFGRERLFGRLDAAAELPGAWLAGPPGIGKTTLVATYLEARRLPCLWLQLDAGDADPATFLHFLRAAALTVAPRRARLLPLPTADDLRDVPGLIRRSFRRLAEVVDPPWALVLDNLQELGDAPALHAGLAAALSELPAGARIFALSRDPPPPAYARARAGQQLAFVDEPMLRFDDADTRRLVALHERAWSPAALRQLTGGWAAAMILLLAARTELDADDGPGGIAAAGPAPDTGPSAEALLDGPARAPLFAFFAGEVLDRMAAADAAALQRIAFLPSATAAMAARISGDPRAGELLDGLARRSLFTERREGTPAAYTFHALFGEFLRERAAQQIGADALLALRLEAAATLAAHGHADAAIAQLLAAGGWDAALALLIRHAAGFVAQGRTAAVRDWLLALPPDLRRGAEASYWLGWCELAANPAGALAHLERARLGFAASGDTLGSFQTASAAADAIVFLGANLHALDPWMAALEAQAPAFLAQRDPVADLRVLPGLLAAFVYRAPGHALTAPLAALAERLLEQPLGASQRILLGTLAFYLLWTGQTGRLDRILAKLDRLCAEPDAAPATLLRWYGVAVIVRTLLGHVDTALANARHALALAAGGPAPMRAKAELMLVLAAVAARDAALTRTHLDRAALLLDPAQAIDTTTYEFQRGLLMLLDRDWDAAARSMRASVASGRASGWPLREHIALLGQALAAAETGAFEEAEAALHAVLTHPFHAVCVWHHWLAGLIEAELALRRADRPRALAALTRAFAVGREFGFDFGPMPYVCGDMMSRLAWLAIEHGIDAPFAAHIVHRHALPAPPDAGERWPWPVRIRTLGGWRLECTGAPAETSRKESRKPLDLLKLVVALGGHGVPTARLCDALWPEAAGDAARNSFDNALHRLRKLLGGEQHLLLRGGALSLDAATCWTDLGALDAGLAEIEGSGLSVDDPAATLAQTERVLAQADRVLALWQGDFLPGDDELPDIVATRARLQARTTRLMGTLGARLERDACHAEAARLYERVLEQQPLAEAVCRRLIACRLVLGQRAEAWAAYRRCRQQLSVVLGIRTAPETDALVAGLHDL